MAVVWSLWLLVCALYDRATDEAFVRMGVLIWIFGNWWWITGEVNVANTSNTITMPAHILLTQHHNTNTHTQYNQHELTLTKCTIVSSLNTLFQHSITQCAFSTHPLSTEPHNTPSQYTSPLNTPSHYRCMTGNIQKTLLSTTNAPLRPATY